MLNINDNCCGQYVCVVLPGYKIAGRVKEICDGFLILQDRCCRVFVINIENILFITPINPCRCRGGF